MRAVFSDPVKMFTLASLPAENTVFNKRIGYFLEFHHQVVSISMLRDIPGKQVLTLLYWWGNTTFLSPFIKIQCSFAAWNWQVWFLMPKCFLRGNVSYTLEHFAISGRLCRWAMRCVKMSEEEKLQYFRLPKETLLATIVNKHLVLISSA